MVVFLIYIHGSPERIARGERGLAITNDLKRHHPGEKHSSCRLLSACSMSGPKLGFDRIAQDD
jgi:hypothetical protein